MSAHDMTGLMDKLSGMSRELQELMQQHGEPGAVIVGFATDSAKGLRVSAHGGANLGFCRIGLVLHLLESTINDPTTPPKLAAACQRMAEVVGMPIHGAARLQ